MLVNKLFDSQVKKALTIYTSTASVTIPKGTPLFVHTDKGGRVKFHTINDISITGSVTAAKAKQHFSKPERIESDGPIDIADAIATVLYQDAGNELRTKIYLSAYKKPSPLEITGSAPGLQ